MSQHTTAEIAQPSVSDLVDHLARFEGPPEHFLLHLLAVQCHIGSAEGGAILRNRGEPETEVLAVYPSTQEGETSPVWLAQSVESAPKIVQATDTVVTPLRTSEDLYDEAPRRHLVMIPLRSAEGVRGVAAFVILCSNPRLVDQLRQRLELTISLLSLYEMRLTLQRRQIDLQRMRAALEVLGAVNEHEHFKAAAMAFCNEVASVWEADRVTLGFLKGRYVRCEAMSHTEKITRKMKLVLDIESAMEECFDQDVEVLHPAAAEATYVSRAAGELAQQHGPNTLCSFPMRQNQKVIGILTAERAIDKPFEIEELEALRLVCELATARLGDLYENDKWIGAKAAGFGRSGLAKLLGHEHTWIKALVAGICILVAFLTFARGTDYADGSFTIEAVTRQIIPAPFAGFIYAVYVEPGDKVVAGETVLATLDTTELLKNLSEKQAERAGYLKQAATLKPYNDQLAQRRQYELRAQEVQTRIDLIKYQIDKARIVAPISGTVLKGDLKRELGKPVEPSDPLFEIAPLDAMRAEVAVLENRIADLYRAQDASDKPLEGELTPVARPGMKLTFIVEKINPIAEPIKQRNVVRVRVKFLETDILQQAKDELWLKPGVEGQARIAVGRAHYIWMWTRDLINWVRMRFWW